MHFLIVAPLSLVINHAIEYFTSVIINLCLTLDICDFLPQPFDIFKNLLHYTTFKHISEINRSQTRIPYLWVTVTYRLSEQSQSSDTIGTVSPINKYTPTNFFLMKEN